VSDDKKLVECAFEPPTSLVIGGVEVFNDKLALQKLVKVDANPLRYLETIMFPSLGVTMGVNQTSAADFGTDFGAGWEDFGAG
jgi:hypothetical protein